MPPGPRHVPLVTNLRCNQACTYCNGRAPADDLRSISAPALVARIRAAVEAGAKEITFTGGEPAMRSDLEALVDVARSAGAEEINLETNATLIDAPRARRLKDAGLARAQVNLACWGAPLDGITRDPGGFDRARAGLEALASAGVVLDVATVVIRSTSPHLAALPGKLADALGEAVRGIEVTVPVQAPDARELVSYEEAAAAVETLVAEARRAALPIAFRQGHAFPPCLLEPASRARLASLYALSTRRQRQPGHSHVDACTTCTLADRCPGLSEAYRARHPLPPIRAIADGRWRRRLTLDRPAHEQVEREIVARSLHAGDDGTPVGESVVRVNFRCNQACAFCFVSTQLPDPRPGDVERAILDAARRGDAITLSGGEPTLNARLLDYVRLSRKASVHPVKLQTNAIRLDDGDRVSALARAGLGHAFVSLHGATAPVAEAATGAPGTFRRTLAGLDNLARAGLRLTLNFVVCGANFRELPPAVELAAERWPGATFNVSFVAASTDSVPRDPVLIPRFTDVKAHLGEALDVARRRGVRVIGFESMCGLPLCVVPQDADPASLFDIPQNFDHGDFIKTDACVGCRHTRSCWGLRRTYAELHGTDELRAVPRS